MPRSAAVSTIALAALALPATAAAEYEVSVDRTGRLVVVERDLFDFDTDRLRVSLVEDDGQIKWRVFVDGSHVEAGFGCEDVPPLATQFGTNCRRAGANPRIRVVFNDGDDRLEVDGLRDGDPFPDTVVAFGENGRDRLEGGAGNDSLNGGADPDELLGKGGNDFVRGDAENRSGNPDELANPGADVLQGGAGDDTLEGGPRDDSIFEGPGSDGLFGEAGNDVLADTNEQRDGADHFDGGPGRDSASYQFRRTKVVMVPSAVPESGASGERDRLVGIESFFGGRAGDDLLGFANLSDATANVPQSFFGAGGDDFVLAGGGDDIVHGGSGDDVLNAGVGSDTVRGAEGDDRLLMRDGVVDLLADCGPGVDVSRLDSDDPAATVCERIELP